MSQPGGAERWGDRIAQGLGPGACQHDPRQGRCDVGFGDVSDGTPVLWFGGRLALRVIIGLTLFSSIVTLILTGLQLYAEFNRDVALLDQRLGEIKHGYSGGLMTSLWNDNNLLVHRQLEGILSLPNIVYAEIRRPDGELISTGRPLRERVVAHRISLIYSTESGAKSVGTLTLIGSLDGVYGSLFERIWIILGSNALKTLAVCVFLFFLVQLMVTRHLNRIARHMAELAPGDRFRLLSLERSPLVRDELSTVMDSINDMQLKLKESHDSLRSREAALKSNVEQLRETKRALEERGRRLERLAADYDKARERAVAESHGKTEFLASMSHELRTPLNAIIGFSEIISKEMFGSLSNEKYLSYAVDIGKSGKHLLSIADDMLDLAKIEAGKTPLNEEEVAVAEALEEAVEFILPNALEGALTIDCKADDKLPPLWADRRALRQVLLNLLSNAVKFTHAGGKVAVQSALDVDGSLVVAVADNGAGIPQGEIETLLKPFGLAESGPRHDHQGTGLGLPLSRSLMELHGGSLTIASDLGAGTTVTLRFPRDRVARDVAGEPLYKTAQDLR